MESFLAWLIESSFLILILFGIRKLFAGKISYAWSYALWLVVLLRFLIPVNVISAPVSVSDLVLDAFPSKETESVAETEGGIVTTGVERSQIDKKDMMFLPEQSLAGKQGEENLQLSTQTEMPDGEMALLENSQMIKTSGDAGEKDWFGHLKKGMASISVLLFLWIVLSNIRLLRILKKNRVLYGWKKSVPIYLTDDLQNPCLYGFFHPAIYLPTALVMAQEQCPEGREEREQIITHEYVHYEHRDNIWTFLGILLLSVHWYNPLVWMAVSASKKDAELFCDETVVRLLGEEKRFCYGKMLIRLAGNYSFGDFRYSFMPVSRKGKEMKRRIRAIAEKRIYSKWYIVPLSALLLVAVGITGSAGIHSDARESGPVANEEEKGAVSGPAVKRNVENSGQITAGFEAGNAMIWAGRENFPSMISGTFGNEWENQIVSGVSEEIYKKYLTAFTEAVNTGTTDEMEQVLAAGSPIHKQQCELVENYYKRGIREELKTYSLSEKRRIATDTVALSSKEEIAVSYADGTSRLVKQKYRYTCQYVDGEWKITNMEEWQA